ncbi:MAG: hypothetical protein JNK02_03055 [Planctomycetes bacterium]|nr:hypothetical protein [Planctomycetota bacterium]
MPRDVRDGTQVEPLRVEQQRLSAQPLIAACSQAQRIALDESAQDGTRRTALEELTPNSVAR